MQPAQKKLLMKLLPNCSTVVVVGQEREMVFISDGKGGFKNLLRTIAVVSTWVYVVHSRTR